LLANQVAEEKAKGNMEFPHLTQLRASLGISCDSSDED
jgi:hypothetical protein